MDHKTEQDAGLLEQAASMLEGLANDERNRGNCSSSEGAACSAHAIRRLAPALLRAGAAPATVAGSVWGEQQVHALAIHMAASAPPSHKPRDYDADMAWARSALDFIAGHAPALEAPAAPMTTAEACVALAINSALHRIRTGNAAGAIEPLEQARAALAAARQAPAAPSSVAQEVIENLLQLARIVDRAVEDWGETKEDESLEVIFHKEEADKMESILEFFDGLPDAPEEEGVILSGPSRAARVLRAQAAPAAPAVDAETVKKAARYDWLRGSNVANGTALAEHFGGSRMQDFDAVIDAKIAAHAAHAAQAKEGGEACA